MAPGKQGGFTILEVLFSLSIFLVLFLGTVTAIVGSLYLSSFVKHKVQAMYWAQRFIEEQRRIPFASITSLPEASISIDTKGTFDTTADDLTGKRIVTVTNIDSNGNVVLTNTDRKRVRIEINWKEKVLGGPITLREYYSTDIANEAQLN